MRGNFRKAPQDAVLERHCANHPITEKWAHGRLGRGAGCTVTGIVCVGPCLSKAPPAMPGLSVLAWLTRGSEVDRDQAERDPGLLLGWIALYGIGEGESLRALAS